MTKVVLITVDALRKDVTYGDGVDTPNIDRLMSKGQVVEQAYANGPNTSRAFPALLCSAKINDSDGCPNRKTVAEAFQEQGFETVAISSNPNAGPYNGYDRGFDDFEDFVQASGEKAEQSLLFRWARKIVRSNDRLYSLVRKYRARVELPYERAETMNEEFFLKLEEGTDQFLFLHYMDPHNPYLPPEDFADTESGAWRNRFDLNERLKQGAEPDEELTEDIWDLYTGEVRYLDHHIGDLLDHLESLDEDVILLFTADHGEQFGEHGAYLHPDELYSVQLNVPFIVQGAALEGGMASHLDIGPTLLAAVGGEEERFEGMDLTREERHAVTVTLGDKRCVVTPDWKLLDDGGEQFLFDADDYLEEENLVEERGTVVEELVPMLEDRSDALQGIEV